MSNPKKCLVFHEILKLNMIHTVADACKFYDKFLSFTESITPLSLLHSVKIGINWQMKLSAEYNNILWCKSEASE